MRAIAGYVVWVVAGLALGLVLAQYNSGGMVMGFLQKLPGCF